MKNVLVITSSPRGEGSYSAKVAKELAERIPGAVVTTRDLAHSDLPHIDGEFVGAIFTPDEARTPQQTKALTLSDELIAELKASDVVIVAASMINFGVPSSLKAWIDHVTRRGLTFNYGEAGPVGLLEGKQAILVIASAGVYSEGPMTGWNHVEPQLRSALTFIGFKDIETVWIEGTAFGQEATDKALANAREKAAVLAVAA